MVKYQTAIQETRAQSLGQEDPLEKGMATQSSILAWRIPWVEKPGRLQSMGSQRVGHNRATNIFFFISEKHRGNLYSSRRCEARKPREYKPYQEFFLNIVGQGGVYFYRPMELKGCHAILIPESWKCPVAEGEGVWVGHSDDT